MRKNFPILIRTEKEKSEDCINITNRRIDKKLPNPIETKEENQF